MIRARTPVSPGAGDESPALLRSQGGFIPQWSSSWRLGEVSLHADKIAFVQPGRPRVEIPLAAVTDVAMERRKFIVVQKDVVRVTYVLSDQKRPRLAWFIIADAGRWLDELEALTRAGRTADAAGVVGASGSHAGVRVSPVGSAAARRQTRGRASQASSATSAEPVTVREQQIEELSATLSPAGERILWHLWERGHADIKELARVADSRSHMEVLTLLREGITGASQRLFGGPVVVFRERATDPVSVSAVCFQWWLERADQGVGVVRAEVEPSRGAAAADAAAVGSRELDQPVVDPVEPLVEIHDEGDTLIVVVMGPGVGAVTARSAEVREGDSLALTVEPTGARHEIVVPLPCGVRPVPLAATIVNGVASLTLAKEEEERVGEHT